jgi:ABC-2 type transport system ATP-binding protein
MNLALRCHGLEKRYGDVVAVNGLSLDVQRGECFGLLGPNGAGKTTTIEILEGLMAPDAGDVEVLGLRWQTDAQELRERLGVQLQDTQLPEKLSVDEILEVFRSFYTQGASVDELVRIVGLESKRTSWVSTLSGGQKQRLSIACALAGDPDLLFLDEPTTGLDPQSRQQLWGILEQFKAGGGTVLLTTHYMDEAEALCDRVAIVDHGRVISVGTPKELIATLAAPKVVVREGTLEDVFMALTGRHLRDE